MQYNLERFEAFIRSRLDEAEVPGAAVCVRDQSGVVYSKAFGYKDEARSCPVDENTVFGVASMSKSVASLAVALLEKEGKLSFDHPVSRYLPGFSIPGTPDETVLVRHLASHTTGLPPLPTLS